MDGGTRMPQLLDLPRVWTPDDLDQLLPEGADWRRYEIVDGSLVVSPSAGSRHEIVSARLLARVYPSLPDGYEVVGPLGLDLGASYRIPDLMVIPTGPYAQGRALVRPPDALLAVEIVSPSSRTTDRITKPAQYAAAGIGAYWRVETDPDVTLTAYALEPGASTYTELGTWGPGHSAALTEPFPVTIAIDALIPSG
ncbi:MAG: Uma2 family endonuclease [Jatrophihabitantaceae bacterium]